MMRLRKSRLRVSSTPITCMPMAGSPWKGMLAEVSKQMCIRDRYKVFREETRSEETLDDFYFWGCLLYTSFVVLQLLMVVIKIAAK